MNPTTYQRAATAAEAVALAANDGYRFLGGGTNLVDLMRQTIERPAGLIDVTGLSQDISIEEDGTLVIGAAARNSAVAMHPLVREQHPMLARAVLAGASGQVRNMATVGGNLMQRTRCAYFYDHAGSRCNKRKPGSGCDAQGGFNRYHAIVGGSQSCVSVHPSDMCVALAALDASLRLVGKTGERTVAMADFHRLPGDTPDIETILEPCELIAAIAIPPSPFAARSTYRKVRDRASYAFALVSIAAGVTLDEAGAIDEIAVAFGGIAPRPWRASRAEETLRGKKPDAALFEDAISRELADAAPLHENAFKVGLTSRVFVAAMTDLTGSAR